KKGDTVQIIKGKDRDKSGKVISVDPRTEKVTVEGLNLYKKHVRPKKQGDKGEIIQVSRPVRISNVGIFCSHCNRGVRVGYRINENQKTRICRKCKSTI
ncbi:50S ribosomal protein L24, partial [Candidatus Jorgensenbacteria bacterium]|nr:50S ribosomal protein L24 [Candidatus Jorgensenbacteria bacterium]